MGSYTLICTGDDGKQVGFLLYDSSGNCCGAITINLLDLLSFFKYTWNGNIDWAGLCPNEELERKIHEQEKESKELFDKFLARKVDQQ